MDKVLKYGLIQGLAHFFFHNPQGDDGLLPPGIGPVGSDGIEYVANGQDADGAWDVPLFETHWIAVSVALFVMKENGVEG